VTRHGALCALLSLAACRWPAPYVSVEVHGVDLQATESPIAKLKVTATLAGVAHTITVPGTPRPLTFPTSFTIEFPADARGDFDVQIDALDLTDRVVADGHTTGVLGGNGESFVVVELARWQFVWTGKAVKLADFTSSGTMPITISGETTLNTDTGAIDGIRGAGPGVIDGIGFPGADAGIWTFSGLTVQPGSTLHLTGARPAVLLSTGSMQLDGLIDGLNGCKPNTPAPGAFFGGEPGQQGGGPAGGGGSVLNDQSAGGEGGSCGGVGGMNAGSPQISLNEKDLGQYLGGSGGGGGFPNSTGTGTGGRGGAFLHLLALGSITINGVINVGGCGGSPGGDGGGGGGGGGGGLLIEAPTVTLSRSSVLAANGGGGGGGVEAGESGKPSDQVAQGGDQTVVPVSSRKGGFGGAGGLPNGNRSEAHSGFEAGGAGGGVGLIRFNTINADVAANGMISPSLGSGLANRGVLVAYPRP